MSVLMYKSTTRRQTFDEIMCICSFLVFVTRWGFKRGGGRGHRGAAVLGAVLLRAAAGPAHPHCLHQRRASCKYFYNILKYFHYSPWGDRKSDIPSAKYFFLTID